MFPFFLIDEAFLPNIYHIHINQVSLQLRFSYSISCKKTIVIEILLKFISKGQIDNASALIKVKA